MRPRSLRPSRTISKIDQSNLRCSSLSRVFRPRRFTSRYVSQVSNCQPSTTYSHSVVKNRCENLCSPTFCEACRISSETCASVAIRSLPIFSSYRRRPIASIEYTSMRSPRRGSLVSSSRSLARRAFARGSENVVNKTRACGFVRARWAARCSATIVFPVPAVPETDIVIPNLWTANLATDRHSRNAQLIPLSIVALHQHTHRVAAVFGIKHPRRRANSTLELVADHSRAAAHIAFFHCTSMCGVESIECIFRLHVKSVGVVQVAVPGLSDDRQRPGITIFVRTVCAPTISRLPVRDSPLSPTQAWFLQQP